MPESFRISFNEGIINFKKTASFKMMLIFHLLFLYRIVRSDIYFHHPRGSNNRLFEKDPARSNNKRLFNSQNNNRGGYNSAPFSFYEDTEINIQWTAQHSCNIGKSHCQFILQLLCDSQLRDGITHKRITTKKRNSFSYGRHESYGYYKKCKNRKRNKNLFDGRNKLKSSTAISTRQNANGDRYGFECPEERDYYPYWHPTPWIDLAIFTDNVDNCGHYINSSENVQRRGECSSKDKLVANTEKECKKQKSGKWKWKNKNLFKPVCFEATKLRDNHLGNSETGNVNEFRWRIPKLNELKLKGMDSAKCTLRVRYNISTGDYGRDVNNKNDVDREIIENNIGKGMSKKKLYSYKVRGYRFGTSDVQFFKSNSKFKLRHTINRNQYGRTFQDRTHVFEIKRKNVKNDIVNLNVRGRKGNELQCYPSLPYAFVPEELWLKPNDLLHIQWTGSNKYNGYSVGDRHNLVFECSLDQNCSNNVPADFTNSQLEKLSTLMVPLDSKKELSLTSPYFNEEFVKIKSNNLSYRYSSPANLEFGERNQFGQIHFTPLSINEQIVISPSKRSITKKNYKVKYDGNDLNETVKFLVDLYPSLSDMNQVNNLKILNLAEMGQFVPVTNILRVRSRRNIEKVSINLPSNKEKSKEKTFIFFYPTLSNSNRWIADHSQTLKENGKEYSFGITKSGYYCIGEYERKKSSWTITISICVIAIVIGLILIFSLIQWRRGRINYSLLNNCGKSF
ncbi:hypothetical protein SNEBB_000765 [Seison nebaliae]|nr:hypothetical protein SNEBB_000765 [Seison nebaliae]